MTIGTVMDSPLGPEPAASRRNGAPYPADQGQEGRQLAWQRTMEQTEWSAWLNHPLLPVARMALPPNAAATLSASGAAAGASPFAAAGAYRKKEADSAERGEAQLAGALAAGSPAAGRQEAAAVHAAPQAEGAVHGTVRAAPATMPAATPAATPAAMPAAVPPTAQKAGAADPDADAIGTAVRDKAAPATGSNPGPQAVPPGLVAHAQLVLGPAGTAASLAGPAMHDPRAGGIAGVVSRLAGQTGWPALNAEIGIEDPAALEQLPEADEAEDAQPGAQPRTAADAPEGGAAGTFARLRLHSEWREQGVRVWLGADQSLQLGPDGLRQLSQLLQTMCGAQGSQLVSLVCNGKLVYGAAPGGTDAARRGRIAGALPERAGPGSEGGSQILLEAIRNYSHFGEER